MSTPGERIAASMQRPEPDFAHWQQDDYSTTIWRFDTLNGRQITVALSADNVNDLEDRNAELESFVRGRFILPTGRCTECGIVDAHQPGCEVGSLL